MKELMLSIIVPTYNHEKYIKKALESILMQKTKYSYEVLVGEDASTDNTRNVIKQYEKEHPGKITVFYRQQNLSKSKYSNSADLRRRAKGKYIITLEGDDFWTSDEKIEKQINFLEGHPDYVAIAHNCVVVDENDNPNGDIYPECKVEEYTFKQYLCGIYPGQLATMLCRNFMIQDIFDKTILEKNLSPGDKLIYFGLLTSGKIYCMQEQMSAYRHIRKGGSSYSANYKYDFKKDENWYSELLQLAYVQKHIEGINCAETLYLGCLIHGLKKKQLSIRYFIQYKRNIKNFINAFYGYIERMYAIHISKKGRAN
ncbi:MAG: glycosyltransferase [Clostridium butyricum]|nr:glycosyltransferase [Clostridium butyricum]